MRVLIVLGLVLFAALPLLPAEEGKPGKLRVYVGTYTGKSSSGHRSEGIYRMDLDLATGQLSEPTLAGKAVNPSFLAIHPTGKYLYACGEVATFAGKKGVGSISAFAIDDKGDLVPLNQQSSEGAGPCHVVLDTAGRYAFCANSGGGSAAALPIGPDGKLGKATGFVQHRGSSVNKARQAGPHAHSINLDAANKYAFVADLGLDKVLIYKFDGDKGTLTPNDPADVRLAPGAGPRHFAFHPNGKNAYVINEMDMTVSAMAYDPATGKLEVIQTVPTKDRVEKGDSTAEVVVHPSGKFVYGSNRGDNRIAVFRCDPATGKLTPAGHQGQGVKTPRNFALDPTGAYCLVANQDGDSVVVFKVNPETGALEPTDHKAQVASPVCVRMMSVR
ncbi:MAG: lactonase family protein [Gemmataceae bacterium]